MFVLGKWHYIERNGWHGRTEVCSQTNLVAITFYFSLQEFQHI